jgi:adenylate cyclase, class 2
MKEEVEAKAIKINKEEIRKKLKELGCKLEFKEKKFVRKTFKLPESSPFIDTSGIWARLRTDGKKSDLALKIYSEKMKWAKEIECGVEDFKVINEFLEFTGFKQKGYEENLRERWTYENIEFDIDTWPLIDPWLEIEAPTEKDIKEWFKKLGLDYKEAYFGSADVVYKEVYNIDILKLSNLLFNDRE